MITPRKTVLGSAATLVVSLLVERLFKPISDVEIQDFWKEKIHGPVAEHLPATMSGMLDWLGSFGVGAVCAVIFMILIDSAFVLGGVWRGPSRSFFSLTKKLNKHSKLSGQELILEFSEAQRRLSGLGNQLDGIKSSKMTVFSAHEYAAVIWLYDFPRFYFVPQDSSQPVSIQPDILISDDEAVYDEEALRVYFAPPANFLPPVGGLAKLWRQNRSRWSWIGWRDWSKTYYSGASFFQEFENGIIIGVMPANKSATHALIYAIGDDGKFVTIRSNLTYLAQGIKAPVNSAGFSWPRWRPKSAM